MRLLRITLLAFWAALLAGCANLPPLLVTPESSLTSPAAPTLMPVTASPTQTAAADEPRLLRIWLPPQFDPAAENDAAQLFQARLDEFLNRRPGLQIEVRVKPDGGTGGLLDALQVTDAAAPQLMPDLVALSRTDLEAAALEGLLHPLDGLTLALDDPDWYPYAHQMAQIQNTIFGLPFAGDALVLVGYTDALPSSWDELGEATFIFHAASPRAYFSLALYLSAGGSLINEQGRPMLDSAVMEEVLAFYAKAVENENLSPGVLTYQSEAEVWQAFKEQRANLVATWTSLYMVDGSLSQQLTVLPALRSTSDQAAETSVSSITLARGYAWALAGSDLEQQALAVELAEYLSASDFLAEWTEAARVLPTRPTALSAWEDARLRSELGQVAETAQLIPANDIQVTIGPLFEQAVAAVLAGEMTPAEAAVEAVAQIK